jgi:hypothetical protein
MVANRGMAILLTNGLCSKRHYLPAGPARDAHLVLAMDNETCPLLERNGFLGPVSVCVPYAERMIGQLREWEPDSLGMGQLKSLADLKGMAENLGHAKKLLLNAKLYAAHDVLRCGFDAFLTDIDVVLMKDPLPLFASTFRRKFRAQMLFQASTATFGRCNASNCWCSGGHEPEQQCCRCEQRILLSATDGAERALYEGGDCVLPGQMVVSGILRRLLRRAIVTGPAAVCRTKVASMRCWPASTSSTGAGSCAQREHHGLLIACVHSITTNSSWALLPNSLFPVGPSLFSSTFAEQHPDAYAAHASWAVHLARKIRMFVQNRLWFHPDISSQTCTETPPAPAALSVQSRWPNCTSKDWDCPSSDTDPLEREVSAGAAVHSKDRRLPAQVPRASSAPAAAGGSGAKVPANQQSRSAPVPAMTGPAAGPAAGATQRPSFLSSLAGINAPTVPRRDDSFCNRVKLAARDDVNGLHAVHVMVANRGMAILLTNGLCSKRHYLPAGPARDAHLVLAMDNETCPLLERNGFLGAASVCVPYTERMIGQLREWEPDSLGKGQLKSVAELSTMADNLGHAKKLLLNAKLYAAHDVLRCGFDAFLTDIDVVLMKDPLPLFAATFRENRNLQMLFQVSFTIGSAHDAGHGRCARGEA